MMSCVPGGDGEAGGTTMPKSKAGPVAPGLLGSGCRVAGLFKEERYLICSMQEVCRVRGLGASGLGTERPG